MRVEPTRLVELAATSESVLATMQQDWADALGELSGACSGLGDAAGAAQVSAAYDQALADAGEVVATIATVLGLGVAGLLDAAHDAQSADDTVADELGRAHRLIDRPGRGDPGSVRPPTCGGR